MLRAYSLSIIYPGLFPDLVTNRETSRMDQLSKALTSTNPKLQMSPDSKRQQGASAYGPLKGRPHPSYFGETKGWKISRSQFQNKPCAWLHFHSLPQALISGYVSVLSRSIQVAPHGPSEDKRANTVLLYMNYQCTALTESTKLHRVVPFLSHRGRKTEL